MGVALRGGGEGEVEEEAVVNKAGDTLVVEEGTKLAVPPPAPTPQGDKEVDMEGVRAGVLLPPTAAAFAVEVAPPPTPKAGDGEEPAPMDGEDEAVAAQRVGD